MSPGIKNPFKKDLLRRQFDSCVLCYFTRHKDLFREDGTRHTGNGVANQFWWGFDGARKPEQWDGSRDTPAYASYRAGEAIAAYEAALAAKDAEIERLRLALKEAREMVAHWGAYASEYFQDKHDLPGDLGELDAVLAGDPDA